MFHPVGIPNPSSIPSADFDIVSSNATASSRVSSTNYNPTQASLEQPPSRGAIDSTRGRPDEESPSPPRQQVPRPPPPPASCDASRAAPLEPHTARSGRRPPGQIRGRQTSWSRRRRIRARPRQTAAGVRRRGTAVPSAVLRHAGAGAESTDMGAATREGTVGPCSRNYGVRGGQPNSDHRRRGPRTVRVTCANRRGLTTRAERWRPRGGLALRRSTPVRTLW